jgi:hypothetical protein
MQMFEFHYCVRLDIVHPSADPRRISERIRGVAVTHETMAGSERRTRRGQCIEPRRKAALTHWGASLHREERIYSGDRELSAFIHDRLMDLQEHRDLFLELGKEGDVYLAVDWFSETKHSAARLDSELLRRCGALGLGIELNLYGPDEAERVQE